MQQIEFHRRNAFAPSSVIIDCVVPAVEGGRFAVKRYIDEDIKITAYLLVSGHDIPKGRVLIRHHSEQEPMILPLKLDVNDEWTASFKPQKLGLYHFSVDAGLDRFAIWKSGILKKKSAGQNINLELLEGSELLKRSLKALKTKAGNSSPSSLWAPIEQTLKTLKSWIGEKQAPDLKALQTLVEDTQLESCLHSYFEASTLVSSTNEMPIQVEPVLARFSSWYEFFPRSTVEGVQGPGTFKKSEERLPYIKSLGFNIVYLPPIHPIGKKYRKGKNNTESGKAEDVGSPWAIGSAEGGHKDVHPDLGTMDDFEHFVKKAHSLQLEVALDLAFQCSPDHPYLQSHPDWFKKRPDGSIQYAENPPKKYQDVYPFDFECKDWKNLWIELHSIVDFWIQKGVKVFRVDNPHTKTFSFWEWLISTIHNEHPEVIFLAEAFTAPKRMGYLAKAGFSQSYTYFTWRNVKWELTQYMTELTQTDLKEYFAANFWPNTPDILPVALQEANPVIYKQRLVLAATLMSNYGIYGPAFELMDFKPLKPGGEEYLDSEKYQIRRWNLNSPQTLAPFISKVNRIRNENKVLQQNRNFRFHPISNELLIAYSKSLGAEKIVVVVNLDSHKIQAGQLELPLIDWKIGENELFQMEDLLTGIVYSWSGWRNYIELRPEQAAHIFKVHIQPPVVTQLGERK